ncbi:MAG TPA: HAMP domain-containing sensor histidine kinase, partial [Gammaproteobacteria bacterium]
VDPFRFALLDADHFVLYRKVWRDGARTIQGLLLERDRFLRGAVAEPFAATALAQTSALALAWRGEVLAAFGGSAGARYLASAAELQGALLQRARLSAPLSELELIFSVTRLPPGPGGTLLGWLTALVALVLLGGFTLLYRLGLGQVRLARQQQDFVSAVSHELKTPLTSIRMYGEMLREGWVDEGKRQAYYDYIHGESERLSRLIDNVLQLARMNRNGLSVQLREIGAGELLEQARAKVAAQVERAGFTLALDCTGDAAACVLRVDPDHFAQIVINLVDNALKFAARAEPKRLDLGCRRRGDGTLQVTLRDHGPGVPPDQLKKIFELFYRPGNELTRETVGTGIGLALVRQLAGAMGGRVDVVNRDPGAEFRLAFPSVAARA